MVTAQIVAWVSGLGLFLVVVSAVNHKIPKAKDSFNSKPWNHTFFREVVLTNPASTLTVHSKSTILCVLDLEAPSCNPKPNTLVASPLDETPTNPRAAFGGIFEVLRSSTSRARIQGWVIWGLGGRTV